jgi:hypothetical protein
VVQPARWVRKDQSVSPELQDLWERRVNKARLVTADQPEKKARKDHKAWQDRKVRRAPKAPRVSKVLRAWKELQAYRVPWDQEV